MSFFYALKVPDQAHAAIEKVRDLLNVNWDSKKSAEKFHLTLRHLGKNHWDPKQCGPRVRVSPEAYDGVRTLQAAFGRPIQVSLDYIGRFRHGKSLSSVFWIGPNMRSSHDIIRLSQALGATGKGLPHVTVGRGRGSILNHEDEYITFDGINFEVDTVQLLESASGEDEYTLIGEFPLT